MLRVRRPVLAGVLAGVVVLVGGCSDPAPTDVPSPAASSVTGAPGTPAPTDIDPSSAAPTATAGSPQPTTGSDGSVEPSRPVETAAPKRLDESSRTAGLTVSLVSVRATTVRATAPGDRSGPGVLVRVKMVNATARTIDTSFTQVSLRSAGRTGSLVDGPPSDPLSSSLRAGRTAEGTYAFLLDDATSAAVTVAVYVTAGQPVVTFSGRVS